MTIESIIEAQSNPPKTAKKIELLLEDTAFELIKGTSTADAPHQIINNYEYDESGKSIIYYCISIKGTYQKILELAIAVKNRPPITINNMCRGLKILNYKQMCEALDLDEHSGHTAITWRRLKELESQINQFSPEKLEKIAEYFHNLKTKNPKYE